MLDKLLKLSKQSLGYGLTRVISQSIKYFHGASLYSHVLARWVWYRRFNENHYLHCNPFDVAGRRYGSFDALL